MEPERAPRTVYDSIGRQYNRGRRQDRRIAERIWAALADAGSVVNVGAGSGSYEPSDRRVVAVEPSQVMIAQRGSNAAPAVCATAESLPFGDNTFDAAMAILTVHHWADKARGLSEMRRVARGPIVLFMGDRRLIGSWWLPTHYFPATARLVSERSYPLELVADALGEIEIIPIPIPSDCEDGFEGAYWQRPRAVLDPAVWGSMSALQMIPEQEREAGMRHLAADLDSGDWGRQFGYLLERDEFDVGYRLVVARG